MCTVNVSLIVATKFFPHTRIPAQLIDQFLLRSERGVEFIWYSLHLNTSFISIVLSRYNFNWMRKKWFTALRLQSLQVREMITDAALHPKHWSPVEWMQRNLLSFLCYTHVFWPLQSNKKKEKKNKFPLRSTLWINSKLIYERRYEKEEEELYLTKRREKLYFENVKITK